MIDHLRNELDSARQAEQECSPRGVASKADWQAQAKQAATQAGNFIAAHPVASIAAAVAIGLAVGWWVKRK